METVAYIFTLRSDSGPYRIRVHGYSSLDSALKFILDHEKAPERAIVNVKIERKAGRKIKTNPRGKAAISNHYSAYVSKQWAPGSDANFTRDRRNILIFSSIGEARSFIKKQMKNYPFGDLRAVPFSK